MPNTDGADRGPMVTVRVLKSRYTYPPIYGTNARRYIAAGDITFMTEQDAARYVASGDVEYYDMEKRNARTKN